MCLINALFIYSIHFNAYYVIDNILNTWDTLLTKAKIPAYLEIAFLFFPLITNYFLVENL